MAKTCKRGMRVQSVRFDSAKFTVAQARSWLKRHGKKYGKVDRAGSQLRFRQFAPGDCVGGSFRTIFLGQHRGIQSVVCCPKRGA